MLLMDPHMTVRKFLSLGEIPRRKEKIASKRDRKLKLKLMKIIFPEMR